MRSIAPRTGVVLFVAGALALGASACGGGDDKEIVAPDPASVPKDAVALVGDVPVPKQDVERLMGSARRNVGTSNGKPIKQTPKQVRERAVGAALRATWLLREAKERGVVVKDVDVRMRWAEVKKGQFRTKRALKRFLGGRTVQDLLLMQRDQMLIAAIEDKIRAEADGDAEEEALEEFWTGLNEGWRRETACRGKYLAWGCANAPEPGAASQ